MPVVRVRTGARILIEVADGSTFPTTGHLASYAGLAPATRSSGSSIRGEHPSTRGNKQLKRAFFLSVFAALGDPASRAYYDKKIAEDKHHTQALLCLARSRADVLFAMLRDGTFMNLSRRPQSPVLRIGEEDDSIGPSKSKPITGCPSSPSGSVSTGLPSRRLISRGKLQNTSSHSGPCNSRSATLMPHVIYLHSALTRSTNRDPTHQGKALRRIRREIVVALAIMTMLVAAAVFHRGGHTGTDTLHEAYNGLGSLLAPTAAINFAVTLLAAGLAASSVGTYAGQIIMEGFLRRRIPPIVRRAATLVPAAEELTAEVASLPVRVVVGKAPADPAVHPEGHQHHPDNEAEQYVLKLEGERVEISPQQGEVHEAAQDEANPDDHVERGRAVTTDQHADQQQAPDHDGQGTQGPVCVEADDGVTAGVEESDAIHEPEHAERDEEEAKDPGPCPVDVAETMIHRQVLIKPDMPARYALTLCDRHRAVLLSRARLPPGGSPPGAPFVGCSQMIRSRTAQGWDVGATAFPNTSAFSAMERLTDFLPRIRPSVFPGHWARTRNLLRGGGK